MTVAETTPDQIAAGEVALHGANGAAHDQTVTVGTPEWDRLTERRAQLISKKNRQGLTDAEWAEYEILQERSRKAIAITFPPPDWSALRVRLADELKREE